MNVRVGLWRKLSTKKLMLLNCGVGEDSWEVLGDPADCSMPGSPVHHQLPELAQTHVHRWVITFLPRNKRLLISWLQSPSAVILETPKIKSDTVSTVSPFISHEVMEPDTMIFVFYLSVSVDLWFKLWALEFGKDISGYLALWKHHGTNLGKGPHKVHGSWHQLWDA